MESFTEMSLLSDTMCVTGKLDRVSYQQAVSEPAARKGELEPPAMANS